MGRYAGDKSAPFDDIGGTIANIKAGSASDWATFTSLLGADFDLDATSFEGAFADDAGQRRATARSTVCASWKRYSGRPARPPWTLREPTRGVSL